MVTMAAMEETKEKQSRWKINKDLLPLKVFNFLMYGACMVIPYITVFLKQLGLTASEIGIIIGCSVFFCLFTRPAIGMLADKLGGRKIALVVCCMGFSTCFFSLRFLTGRRLNTFEYRDKANRTQFGSSDVWICRLESYRGITMDRPSDHGGNKITSQLNERYQTSQCHTEQSSKDTAESADSQMALMCPFVQSLHQFGSISNTCISTTVEDSTSKEILYYQIGFNNHNKTVLLRDFDTHLIITNKTPHFRDEISTEMPGCFQKIQQHCTSDVIQSSATIFGDALIIQFPADFMELSGIDGSSFLSNIKFDDIFILAIIINLAARAFYASTTSLADALIYSILGPNRHRWARQRLWGSLGTGISLIVTTTISAGFHQTNNLSAMLPACLCLTFLACVVVLTKLNTSSVKKNANLFQDLHTVLSNPTFRLHLCKLILYGFMAGTAQNFFMWFIADIGGSSFNMALIVVVDCVSSIVLLRFTGRLLKKLGSLRTMYLVLIAYSLRFLAMSFIETPWMALPLELLHGITYSVLWASASGFTSKMAAPGTQATCHSIAGAVYWDLGRGLGIVMTGQFIQEIGARWTFRTYTIICLAAIPLFYALDWLWPLPQSFGDEHTKEEKELPLATEEKEVGEIGEEEGEEEEEEEGSVINKLLIIPNTSVPSTPYQTENISDKTADSNSSSEKSSQVPDSPLNSVHEIKISKV